MPESRFPDVEGVTFKDIEGFPGYCVGDDGSVWSNRSLNGLGYAPGRFPWRQLRLIRRRKDGYLVTTIRNALEKRQVLIHRLVLETFVGPCPPGMMGCHFPDASTANNRLSNLRWDTQESNEADKAEHGTVACGSRHGHAKLTEADIPVIRDLHAQGVRITDIARRFDIERCAIQRIVNGEGWKHVPHAPVPRHRDDATPLPLFSDARP